jgi:hypothetical protein
MMNTQKKFLFCGAIASLLMSNTSFASDSYNLFHPVPDDKLRAMTAERPSKTDGPFSLDAGRIQIETSLFAHTKNDDCTGGTCTKTTHDYVGGATNLRIGLTDDTDLQIISDLYHHSKTESGGVEDSHEGLGDTQVRLKLNVMGNDPSSKFSLALSQGLLYHYL